MGLTQEEDDDTRQRGWPRVMEMAIMWWRTMAELEGSTSWDPAFGGGEEVLRDLRLQLDGSKSWVDAGNASGSALGRRCCVHFRLSS